MTEVKGAMDVSFRVEKTGNSKKLIMVSFIGFQVFGYFQGFCKKAQLRVLVFLFVFSRLTNMSFSFTSHNYIY